MATETQILVLFEEGNPVPDLDDLRRIDLDAAAYLATLTSRSSDMTRVDERIEQKEGKRRLMPWFVAAAVLIAVVALGIVFLGPEEDVVTSTTVSESVPEGLIGFWTGDSHSFALNDDGTYAIVMGGLVVDSGSFEILGFNQESRSYEPSPTGDWLELTSGPDSLGCAPGNPAGGAFSFDVDGSLQFILEQSDCFATGPGLGGQSEGTFRSSAPLELRNENPEIEGTWGSDSGVAVTFDSDTYTIARDGAVLDQGTYEIDVSPYRISFTTTVEGECAANDSQTFVFVVMGEGPLILDTQEGDEDVCRARRAAIVFTNLDRIESPETADGDPSGTWTAGNV